MSLFFKERDLQLFKSISEQLVQKVMQINVMLYKINPQQIQINVYGEAKRGLKSYHKGVSIFCLIEHTAHSLDMNESMKRTDTTRFKFLISTLQDVNIYPEIGDVIQWQGVFWEITLVTSQQLIANNQQIEWSKICQTAVLSNSKTKQLLSTIH